MRWSDNKKSSGFTIIEVLIVLAIAGLIILIVFLAVPALQRNQRNNQRRADVGLIAAQYGEYLLSNGNQPIEYGIDRHCTNTFTVCFVKDFDLSYYDTKQITTTTVAYFDPNKVIGDSVSFIETNFWSTPAEEIVIIAAQSQCAGRTIAPEGPFPKQTFSIQYAVETRNGYDIQCVDG